MRNHRFHFSRASLRRIKAYEREPAANAEQEMPPAEEGNDVTEENTSLESRVRKAAPPGLRAAGLTDIGLRRPKNQDAIILAGHLFGVADGMGGHLGGEVASSAVQTQMETDLISEEPCEGTLRETVLEVNSAVCLRGTADPSLHGMGTTLTAAWFGEKEVYLAQVGDSRCYLLREGELQRVTEDHSVVMELVRSGILTEEEASSHPMRNIITRAIGTDLSVQPDMQTLSRKAGDVWLICSDGLHGLVERPRLKEILEAAAASGDPAAAVVSLVEAALAEGGTDNISAVVVLDTGGAA